MQNTHWRGNSFVALLLLLFVAYFAHDAHAFKTPFKGVGPNIHLDIAHDGLSEFGFQKDALDAINAGMASQDDLAPSNGKFWKSPQNHCDDNKINEGHAYFTERWQVVYDAAKDCYKNQQHLDVARYALGEGLHALHDFYSHSNWVELNLAWNRKPPPVYSWPTQLPPLLKTGYFTIAEGKAIGEELLGKVTSIASSPSETTIWFQAPSQNKHLWAEIDKRPEMIAEARKASLAHFEPAESFYKRWRSADYETALSYVINSQNITHFELNKDDDKSLEGLIKTPSGQTLHEIAKDCAKRATAEEWQKLEDRCWKSQEVFAALAIPAIKGEPIPYLTIDLHPRRTQTLNQPLEGSCEIILNNKKSIEGHGITFRASFSLHEDAPEGKQIGQEITKIVQLENYNDVYNFNLKDLNFLLPDQPNSYYVVAKAAFDRDPTYKPAHASEKVNAFGELIIDEANALPNPQFAGSPINLELKFHTVGCEEGRVFATSSFESEDGTYFSTAAPQQIIRPGTGDWPIVKYQFEPPKAGNYTWKYSLRCSETRAVKGSKVLKALPQQLTKSFVIISQTLNKSEVVLGDTIDMKVVYKIGGLNADKSWVDASETSEVMGQSAGTVSLPSNTRRINYLDNEIVKEMTFKPTAIGVFDWRYSIDIPEFGGKMGTLTFVVKPKPDKAALKLISADVTPTRAKLGETVTLKVKYAIDNLGNGISANVVESSTISGPVTSALPSRVMSVTGTSVIEKQLDFVPPKSGTYDWYYRLDAGQYGTIDNNSAPLQFTIAERGDRKIQLVSAAVQPPSGPAGSTFVLRVQYQLTGMNAGENIAVSENDQIVGWKTKYNETSNPVAQAANPILTKVASFTADTAGEHQWKYSMDAVGFESLYGNVPFNVIDNTPKPKLGARLEYPTLTLAPGESKSCAIYIRGYRGNTSDRVEVVYPEIAAAFGDLPGQIQAFPGNTSMEPWAMRGAGDFTKEYYCVENYRAKETAPLGTTPVKIVVRQKDGGEVALTLMVNIVRKGTSTQGTENPMNPGGDDPNSSSGPGAGQPGAAGAAGAGTSANAAGQNGAGVKNDDNTITYYFKKGTIEIQPVDGIGITGYSKTSAQRETKEFTTTTVAVPFSWEENWQYKAGNASQSASGVVNYTFPEKIVLTKFPSDPSTFQGNPELACTADAQFTRNGPTSAWNATPVGIFAGNSQKQGPSTNSATKDQKTNFNLGRQAFSLKWRTNQFVSEQASLSSGKPAHQPTLNLQNLGDSVVGIGGNDINFTARVISPVEVVYTLQPGATAADGTSNDNTVNTAQISAKLEKSQITLEAGAFPGVGDAIILQNWKRDTSEPIEIIFPGQGFLGALPNEMKVFTGSGKQGPDVLARMQTDNGDYRWTQTYLAERAAKPGLYKIPITVKQKGAGAVYLTLTVQVVSSTSKFGDKTSLFKGKAPATKSGWGNWTPTAVPQSQNIPIVTPSAPTAPVHTAPSSGSAWGGGWKPTAVASATPTLVPVHPPAANTGSIPSITTASKPPVALIPHSTAPCASTGGPSLGTSQVSSSSGPTKSKGGVIFVRTGPFIEQNAGGVAQRWRVEIAQDKIICYSTIDRGRGPEQMVSTITLTVPPERIAPGDTIVVNSNMTGDCAWSCSGYFVQDGQWFQATGQNQHFKWPETPSSTSTYQIHDVEELINRKQASIPPAMLKFLRDRASTYPPKLKFNASWGSAYVTMEWRYQRVAATGAPPKAMPGSGAKR